MLKFNNSHIFTGYLKQLLSDFNLPTCRIYTKEHAKYFEKYGTESPEIIETIKTNSITYKDHVRYIPYIKDGQFMEYVFTEDPSSTNSENAAGSAAWQSIGIYYEGMKKRNYTKRLRITNNIYDTYTHEYLGEYLRFLRDYHQVNLMPLYNCFSNKVCTNLYIDCEHSSTEGNSISHFVFNTTDTLHKIYMLPVKLFKEYTIAIDCQAPVEICCGIYGKYQDTNTDTSIMLSHDTYRQYNHCRFNHPILYSPLKDVQAFLSKDSLLELAVKEGDLKMFIKLPANNSSSITVLEGNYVGYNDRFTYHSLTTKNDRLLDSLKECKNHTVMNMLDEETGKIIDLTTYLDTRDFKPVAYLSLLAYNTGVSYPFADRLIEYLTENAITPLDQLPDNIERVQTVMEAATENEITGMAGVWDERMQPVLYSFMQEYYGKPGLTQDVNHDILGYVDKDVEQLFAAYSIDKTTGKYMRTSQTIANVDIYPDLYLATKTDD